MPCEHNTVNWAELKQNLEYSCKTQWVYRNNNNYPSLWSLCCHCDDHQCPGHKLPHNTLHRRIQSDLQPVDAEEWKNTNISDQRLTFFIFASSRHANEWANSLTYDLTYLSEPELDQTRWHCHSSQKRPFKNSTLDVCRCNLVYTKPNTLKQRLQEVRRFLPLLRI